MGNREDMKHLDLKGDFELIPVVEVLPFRYSNRALPTEVGAREHPAEWLSFFRACMADAGHPDVEPISPGSHFVALNSLNGHPLLERLGRDGMDQCNWSPGMPLQELSPLDGGFALMAGQERLLEPGCCCDLGHVGEWLNWLSQADPRWGPWYGHPVLEVRAEKNQLVLTEGWESPPAPARLLKLTIDRDAFKASLGRLVRQLEAVQDFAPRPISRRLLGLHP